MSGQERMQKSEQNMVKESEQERGHAAGETEIEAAETASACLSVSVHCASCDNFSTCCHKVEASGQSSIAANSREHVRT